MLHERCPPDEQVSKLMLAEANVTLVWAAWVAEQLATECSWGYHTAAVSYRALGQVARQSGVTSRMWSTMANFEAYQEYQRIEDFEEDSPPGEEDLLVHVPEGLKGKHVITTSV